MWAERERETAPEKVGEGEGTDRPTNQPQTQLTEAFIDWRSKERTIDVRHVYNFGSVFWESEVR